MVRDFIRQNQVLTARPRFMAPPVNLARIPTARSVICGEGDDSYTRGPCVSDLKEKKMAGVKGDWWAADGQIGPGSEDRQRVSLFFLYLLLSFLFFNSDLNSNSNQVFEFQNLLK